LVLTTMITSGRCGVVRVGVGLFNSIMFPTIFTLAIARLGKHTSQGSGILCMAIVGRAGSGDPGAIADRIGIHHCFIIPALCYLYILWYGLKGHVHARARRGRVFGVVAILLIGPRRALVQRSDWGANAGRLTRATGCMRRPRAFVIRAGVVMWWSSMRPNPSVRKHWHEAIHHR